MSRVEEALRRAADQGARNAPPVEPPVAVDEQPDLDPTTLAREPFPLEMPGARPVPWSAPAPGAGPAPVPPPAPVPVSAAVREADPGPASIIQRIDDTFAEKVVADRKLDPASREQYRRLAATLHQAQRGTGLKVVMIASAVPREGKTLTATNLALTFSESYQRRVLLIDADLRRPTLHTVFSVDNSSGLSEGLMADESHRLPVRDVSPRLAILPAGEPSNDPMAGLTSDRMRRLIAEAREAFDWVIIDTPPVVLLPDANLLGAMVDAAVLIVRAGSTSYDLVNRALTAVGREKIIGVVLNSASEGSQTKGEGFYYGYLSQQQEAEGR